MVQSVIGAMIVTGALISLVIAACKYSSGSRQFGHWQGGGKIGILGLVSGVVFAASIGAVFLTRSAIWILPGLCAWLIGFISQNRANRQHQIEEDELRRRNALDHPGIFDSPPPGDFDAIPGEHLRLYDAGACTFIGVVTKSDMRAVIHALAEISGRGNNDIFVILESLDIVPKSQLSRGFIALLEDALTRRNYLVLRWMPCVQGAYDGFTPLLN